LWMTALVLLLTAGMASAQEQDQPSQDQPSSDVPASSSAAADSAYPDTVASPGTDDASAAMSADLYNASNPYTGLPPLGTPLPLPVPRSGMHLGPFYLTGVSDSFYYSIVNSQGNQNGNNGSYNFWGDNIVAGVALSHPVGERGQLSFRASPQLLIGNSGFTGRQTWFNLVSSLSYTDQLTDRWTISAASGLAYFQNSILTNPQYALLNTSAGYVLTTIYTQTTQPAFYQYAGFSASYRLGEKTTLSLSPTVGESLSNSSGPVTFAFQLGGYAAVSHQYSSRGTVSVFYGLSHSSTPSANNTGRNGWNSSSFGVGITQGLGGETWSLAFNVASNSQSTPSLTWSVIGNAALIKKLGDGVSSISANYSRSQAALLTQTPGYFDQASIGYNRVLGEKTNIYIGAGAYRSNQNLQSQYINNAHGVRVSGSVFYRLLPNLDATAGFFLGQQYGAGGNQLYLFNGRSSSFNIGVTWTPGREASVVPNPSGVGNSVPIY
jgi:hypothetical protein